MPNEGEKPVCEKCRFWDVLPEGDTLAGSGLCRRHAPRARLVEPHTDFDPLPLWPATHPDDWCGEFAPRPDAPPAVVDGWRRHSDPPPPPRCDLGEAFDYRLPLQALNVLESRGILRLDQLLTWDAEGLLALPRFGPWMLGKVREALAARGLALRGDPPPVDAAPPPEAG